MIVEVKMARQIRIDFLVSVFLFMQSNFADETCVVCKKNVKGQKVRFGDFIPR